MHLTSTTAMAALETALASSCSHTARWGREVSVREGGGIGRVVRARVSGDNGCVGMIV